MSTREEIIARLRLARPALERRGVARLWLFGSVARGDDRPDSDVDLAFDWVQGRDWDLLDWGEVSESVREILGRAVDIGPIATLKPDVAAQADEDLVRVF